MQTPDATALRSALVSTGVRDVDIAEEGLGVLVRLPADRVADALLALRDGQDEYSMLLDLFGVDTGTGIEVTYHLRSFSRDQEVFLRAGVAYGGELPSVWQVYPASLYQERETAEHFGVSFAGHPNPKRLLTSDEIPAPLLLKSTAIRTVEEAKQRG